MDIFWLLGVFVPSNVCETFRGGGLRVGVWFFWVIHRVEHFLGLCGNDEGKQERNTKEIKKECTKCLIPKIILFLLVN